MISGANGKCGGAVYVLFRYIFQDHVCGASVRDSVTAKARGKLTDIVIETNQRTTEFCESVSGITPQP